MPLVTRAFAQGEIFKQDDEPSDKTDGNIWIDTNDSPNTINIATGTAYRSPAFKINNTILPAEALV